MSHDTFHAGDLRAIIGDNAAAGEHRAGYNGVWSLTHKKEPANLFVPAVAGLNFEHIFDGDREDHDNDPRRRYEPRHAPMAFKKLSDAEAELHQPPTPLFHLESWTRFRLVAPHYLDMEFRCKPTQHVFTYGYIGLFWASYINAPDDKSIYFRDNGAWQQLCTQKHNDESTVVGKDDRFALKFTRPLPPSLFKSISPLRYDEPFYYGLFRGQLFLLMFAAGDGIRISHSPSGGGFNRERQTSNPAWDWQFIVPKYEVNREYGFKARVVYRERCGREEILKEVAAWRNR